MKRREVLERGAALAGAGALAAAGAQEQSLAERIGFRRDDRLLMIHADDIGMCRSVNRTSAQAMLEGVVSSGSVMVPCPWFPQIAAWSQEHPEADLGLHLTLTSEWRHYRWRSVAPPDAVKGLLDPDGFLWRSAEEAARHASPREVEAELRAQIARARQFGMKPTHVDSHMGALFESAGFFDVYTRVAREAGIMPMLPRPSPDLKGEAPILEMEYRRRLDRLEEEGFVLLDRLSTGLKGDTLAARREAFYRFLDGLTPGVTELICHLAGDDDEIQNVTNSWRTRFHEFQLFTDPAVRARIRDAGVKLVGYRHLARAWRA